MFSCSIRTCFVITYQWAFLLHIVKTSSHFYFNWHYPFQVVEEVKEESEAEESDDDMGFSLFD